MVVLAIALLAPAEAHAAREDERGARASGQESTRRPVALTLNPLGIVIQRYGGNVEWSPAPHHALIVSGYVQSVPVELVRPFTNRIRVSDGSAAPALGGELGYRLYSGRSGPEGLFIGGSLVAMPFAYPRLANDATLKNMSVELARVYGLGGAIDIGAQTITSFGLTLGGGIGASFLTYDMPQDPQRLPIAMPSVLPRLLLSTGYAF